MDAITIELRPSLRAGDAPLRLTACSAPVLDASARPLIRAATLAAILAAALALPAFSELVVGPDPARGASAGAASPAAPSDPAASLRLAGLRGSAR